MQNMKNFFLKNPVRAFTGIALFLTGSMVGLSAQADISTTPPPVTGITSIGGVFALISQIFNILFWLLIVLAAIFIILAAFSYLTAGGDPEKIKTANQKVIYAAVAVVVAVLAKTIPSIVCSFIGASGGCVVPT